MENTQNLTPQDSSENTPTDSPALTPKEIIRAATNSPALAADQFQLGDRIFPIVDLEYDDYMEFVGHLQPVVEFLIDKVREKASVSIPGISLTPSTLDSNTLITVCGKTLPQLVCIMCRQTDKSMTVEQVKKLAKKPLPLASIVLKQIKQNGMIRDFSDFFVQLMPLLAESNLKP